VLHLDRPGLMARGESLQVNRDRLKLGELAMFEDFFEQVTGDPPSKEQRRVVAGALSGRHREEF
jgi:exonuclease SbcD